ncbi:MAG: hypothetical protein ACLFUG_01920 [Nitriliruptoraceae bacterium]
MALPDHLLDLSTQQLGLLARRQVVAELGEVVADRRLRSPWFERVERGVVRLRGGASHPCQQAVAAALRCGPEAVLTGPAAVHLLDADGVTPGGAFEIVLPGRRRVRGVSFPTRREAADDRETWLLGGVRVAEPADALIESCLLHPPPPARQLRQVHDRLRWQGRLRPGALGARVPAITDARPPALRDLLELDGQASTGEGERSLGRLLQRFDPPPEPQVWVTPYRRVDWLFRALQLGIEYQGRVDHAWSDGRFGDRTRDDELAQTGLRLLYVSAEDLRDPQALLVRIASAVASRAYERGLRAPTLTAA